MDLLIDAFFSVNLERYKISFVNLRIKYFEIISFTNENNYIRPLIRPLEIKKPRKRRVYRASSLF